MIGGNITPWARWGLPMPGMFLCAGPCGAESEDHLRQTAAGLAGCTRQARAFAPSRWAETLLSLCRVAYSHRLEGRLLRQG
jgi:hypothetical protein